MKNKGMFSGGTGISLDDLDKSQETPPTPEVQPDPEPSPEPAPEPEPTPDPTPEPPADPEVTPPGDVVTPPVVDPADIQKSGENFEFLNVLNEKFNQKFESVDQAVDAFNKPTMESEYATLKTEHDDLQSKFELILEQTDLTSHFSEDAIKLEVWRKDNPSKDVSIAQKIFATEDLTSVSDLEMVKMGRKFSNPKLPGTEKDLEAAIAEEFGVEDDTPFDEWPKTAQIRLASTAGSYRDQFSTIKQGVKLPERVDIEALKTERQSARDTRKERLTTSWTQHADELSESMKELKFPVGRPKEGEDQQYFTWELSAPPKDKVSSIAKGYINMGVDFTDETKGMFDKATQTLLIEENLPAMLQQYGDDLLARQKEDHLKKTHNPDPLKDTQRTEVSTDEQIKKERTSFATGGMGSAIFNNPLFKIKNE